MFKSQRSTKPLALTALATIAIVTTMVWACSAGPATGATPLAATAAPVAVPPPAEPAPLAATNRTHLPVVTTGPAQQAGTGWHQLGGDPARTHYVGATLPARGSDPTANWRVRWVWNGPAAQDSGPPESHLHLPDSAAPVIGDGRLYIGHNDGAVRAIAAADGREVWTRPLGGRFLNVGAYDPTTQAVYFASDNGRLYKLRAADGAPLGEFNAGSPIEGAVLLVDGTVYVTTAAGNLFAVRADTMQARWANPYGAGAAVYASPAYSRKAGGLVIFTSEDGNVHAVRAADGIRAWRTTINSYLRPLRGSRPARRFPDSYPVVAENADVVILRSYYNWELTWLPNGGAPADQAAIRSFIQGDPTQESLFVLDLDDGVKRFTAPVMGGAIGNGNYYYSSPPQVVVKTLANGEQVAYLLWRNRSACLISNCDGREDTTIGEMNLSTGSIRFVRDHKNAGTMRFPTDEQGTLSMVGDVLFHTHWMSLGAIRITNRETGGGNYGNPIPSEEYLSVTNTVGQGQCTQRNSALRYCPVGHTAPGDGYQLDPGFYIYYASQKAYDRYFTPPQRSPIYDNGVVYWKSVDGAIIALAASNVVPAPVPSADPRPSSTTNPGPAPSGTAVVRPFKLRLPVIRS